MSPFTALDDCPSSVDVDRIATLGDAVLRNLQITQCYHELALALAKRTGSHANWCNFATWASKQAGETIRKEDLERALKNILTTTPTTVQAAANVATAAQPMGAQREWDEMLQSVWEALNPFSALQRASDAVARGNRKVFAEIGREFARFIPACLNDMTPNADTIVQFCASLWTGDPPDGQRYLRQAFTRYYQAFFETEPQTSAELVLLANLEIGLHEQTRLQPEIAAALDAWLVHRHTLTRRLLGTLFPHRGFLAYLGLLFRRLLRRPTPLDTAINQLIPEVQQQVRRFITEHLMVLSFPHGVRLRLGDDLQAEFPALLKHITYPELLTLLEQIDPNPDSLSGTGAADWADLPGRLHFIAALFRCYQEAPDLWEPAFTPDQVTALKAGRLPSGPL